MASRRYHRQKHHDTEVTETINLKKRRALSKAVALMFILLLLGFLTILFASLNNSKPVSDTKETQFSIIKGATKMQRHQNQRAWVSHLSEQQIQQHKTLNDWLFNPDSGCDIKQAWCVINATTQKQGIEIGFINKRPPQIAQDVPWLGGFINPNNGAVYDLFGRAYKSNTSNSKQDIAIKLTN